MHLRKLDIAFYCCPSFYWWSHSHAVSYITETLDTFIF